MLNGIEKGSAIEWCNAMKRVQMLTHVRDVVVSPKHCSVCFLFRRIRKMTQKKNEYKCIRLDASDSFVHRFEWIFDFLNWFSLKWTVIIYFKNLHRYTTASIRLFKHTLLKLLYLFWRDRTEILRNMRSLFDWIKNQANSTITCWIIFNEYIASGKYLQRDKRSARLLSYFCETNWVTSI